MNIFNLYLDKIKKITLNLSKNGKLILPEKLDGITTEIPPLKFNSDISTNVAMVLSKSNKKSPSDLAITLVESIKQSDELIEDIKIINPGFINIKFKPIFWTNFVQEIIKKLFNKINLNPKKFISKKQLSTNKYRAISDFISGMTDRYAINLYNNIK